MEFEAAALPKHAAAIRKRMNTLRSTIRSKHQRKENGTGHVHGHTHSSRGDVRNVFNAFGGPQSHEASSYVRVSVQLRVASVVDSFRLVSYSSSTTHLICHCSNSWTVGNGKGVVRSLVWHFISYSPVTKSPMAYTYFPLSLFSLSPSITFFA